MGCTDCGKKKKRTAGEQMKEDHAAMNALRHGRGDGAWTYDGRSLRYLQPNENALGLERYNDPSDAIREWIRSQLVRP